MRAKGFFDTNANRSREREVNVGHSVSFLEVMEGSICDERGEWKDGPRIRGGKVMVKSLYGHIYQGMGPTPGHVFGSFLRFLESSMFKSVHIRE